jgi:hypothetical protein
METGVGLPPALQSRSGDTVETLQRAACPPDGEDGSTKPIPPFVDRWKVSRRERPGIPGTRLLQEKKLGISILSASLCSFLTDEAMRTEAPEGRNIGEEEPLGGSSRQRSSNSDAGDRGKGR